MRGFVRGGIILVLLTLGQVFANSSFAGECDKVRSSYAHAVCDNVGRKAQQIEMEATYQALLATLSDRARSALKTDQRAWRDFAVLACSTNGEIQTTPFEGEQLYCVEEIIWGRMELLDNDWRIGSVQTFPLGVYASKVDEVNTMGPRVGKYMFSAAVMDATDALGVAFNDYAVGGYADGLLKPDADLELMSGEVDSELYVRVIEITPLRVSSIVRSNTYYHGAAHGSHYLAYDHFLIAENRALVAEDIFAGNDWQQSLMNITARALEEDESLVGDLWDDISDALVMVIEVERWQFTDEGLAVQFQPYEIASFARGLPSVTIGWDKLAGILAPGALVIVGNN